MREPMILGSIVADAVRNMMKNEQLTESEICDIMRCRGFNWRRLADILRIDKRRLYHWFYDTYERRNDPNDRLTENERDTVYAEVFRELNEDPVARIDYSRVFPLLLEGYNKRVVVACVSNARARWRSMQQETEKFRLDFSSCCFIAFE